MTHNSTPADELARPMDDVERIAAGLTKAQRDTLLTAYSIGDLGYLTTFASGRSVPALFRRGLTHLSWTPSGLTDLGIAVRNHIKGQDNAG